MLHPDAPARQRLAEQAARRVRLGLAPGPALEALRAVTTAELLDAAVSASPGRRAADAAEVLGAVCDAARQAVRRPAGWLYAAVDTPAPVAVPAALLTAAVLAALRTALQTPGRRAVVRCLPRRDQVIVCVQAGDRADTADAAALWRAAGARGGGTCVFGGGPVFTAALRLPLCPGLPLAPAATARDLLADRYALPYVYLGEWCAGPWT